MSREKDETITDLVDRAERQVKRLDATIASMQHKLQQNGG